VTDPEDMANLVDRLMLENSAKTAPYVAHYDMIQRMPYNRRLVREPGPGAELIRFYVTTSTVIVKYDGTTLYVAENMDLAYGENADGTTTTANLPEQARLNEYWVSTKGNVSVKSESLTGTQGGRVPEIYLREPRLAPWVANKVVPYALLDILCGKDGLAGREARMTSGTVEWIESPDDPSKKAMRLTWWHLLAEIPGMAEKLTPSQRESGLANKIQITVGLNPLRRLAFASYMGAVRTNGPWNSMTSDATRYIVHEGVPVPFSVVSHRGNAPQPEVVLTMTRFEDARSSVSQGMQLIQPPPMKSRLIRDNRKGKDAKPEEIQLSTWPDDAVVMP
jgi:hypothetical protein